MNSASAQFVPSKRMGLYEPMHHVDTWIDFKSNTCFEISPSMILDVDVKIDNQSEDNPHGTVEPSNKYDQEAYKPEKVRKRLAQNREAARKSRQRKKAYVQQLENSKLKLHQLEQEVERSRKQGVYAGNGGLNNNQLGYPGTINPVIATFETEYGHWVEEQDRQILELRSALNSEVEEELSNLVDNSINHYNSLFIMKATAAKADVFYILSGLWKTSAERIFFWIGGFRPSEFLKVLLPKLEPLEEHQSSEIYNLARSCQQTEEALSQGMDRLRQTTVETIAATLLTEGNYGPQMGAAMKKLEALVRFVDQADHIRQETLQQICRILSTHQAARGLLALGEYLQRLRALSSVWTSRPREAA